MKYLFNIFDNTINELSVAVNGEKGKPNASFAPASNYISPYNHGFSISGKRYLTLADSRMNCITIGASGQGKSQVQVFPTILNKNCSSSYIVTDNSGELSQTIPFLESQGVRCLVFDVTKEDTPVYLNSLDGCKNVTDYRKIAQSITSFSSSENDFFTSSARDLIALFIQYVCESESRVSANLINVYRLILEFQGDPEVLKNLMAARASDEVWTKLKAVYGSSERTLKSITATALSILSWIESPTIAKLSSISNFKWEDFRKRRHALFITTPPSDADFYAPLVSLIFESFYRHVFRALPKRSDLDIMCIMDEFSTYAPGLPNYSNVISNSRKYKIPQNILLQDLSQLSSFKELAKNILMNCSTKIYYGGMSAEQAQELERLLGIICYTNKDNQERTAPLMSAQELREMKAKVLVVPSANKAYLTKITPAYKQRKFKKRLAMQPPVVNQEGEDKEEISYSVQYIDLSPFRMREQQKQIQDLGAITELESIEEEPQTHTSESIDEETEVLGAQEVSTLDTPMPPEGETANTTKKQ